MSATYEIILVDDRSPDRGWSVMRELAKTYPDITMVRLSRNFGQHYAITAGLDLATGEWTVLMDCDLQDQPEEIPRLLAAALDGGYDIVLARRLERRDTSNKRLSSRLFYWLFNVLSGYSLDPAVGSFRIMRSTVVEAYGKMRETARLSGAMIEWLGFETGYCDVKHASRYEGTSSYDFRRLMRLAIDGMISFSNRPLTFSIAIGLIMACVAVGFGIFLLTRYMLHPQIGVPGWLSTVTLTTFIGGLVLLNLGILGIYIGRIYDQAKARPLYVVDRIIRSGASANAVAAASHDEDSSTHAITFERHHRRQ
jgi:dolichol-phosphate mannosyltransferase